MKRKPKQRRSFILKIVIFALSVYMIVMLTTQLTTLNQSQAELDAILEYKYKTEQDIEELKTKLADKTNKLIIEKAARERLGYIYSDEQIFIDISGS